MVPEHFFQGYHSDLSILYEEYTFQNIDSGAELHWRFGTFTELGEQIKLRKFL